MRFLLLLILVVAGGGVAFFYHNEAFRDRFRGWRISDEDRARFEAYEKGKAVFRSAWSGAGSAHFQAWNDDAGETAAPLDADGVTGDIWMARGHFTVAKNGAEVQEQWCQAFDRATGANKGLAVDHQAEDALRKLDAGEYRKKPAQTAGAASSGPPGQGLLPGQAAPQKPAAGSWMWGKDGRSALDQPAKKDGS
jgi:hypothetical protein